MTIQLYNTLTRRKEDLVPLDPDGKTVNMYTCGVTVYDKCHIGHARSLYTFDMIRRYLTFRGYQVRFARNITDVDDKIINKACELGKAFEDVVDENLDLYHHDLKSLGILGADFEPRATENIEAMVHHIQALVGKGFAYESGGDVYFKVRAFENYGKLSGQSVDQMLEAVRIDPGSKKKDVLDFALWKKAKDGEPSWESPWGKGRPGWHIECSVMSMKELGCKTLDIHAGGLDLQFPHHENEVAQSEALTGQPFAKYWIHHGLLKINGQKMAKSLGNFITVADALKKYAVDDIKMLFLLTHYRSMLDFSDDKMTEVRHERKKFWRFFQQAKKIGASDQRETLSLIKRAEHEFVEAMDDDFNTPKARAVLFDLMTSVNKLQGNKDYEILLGQAAQLIQYLLTEIFGFSNDFSDLEGEFQKAIGDTEVASLIEERKNARLSKNYQRSDEIRDMLRGKGIVVKDTPNGQEFEPV